MLHDIQTLSPRQGGQSGPWLSFFQAKKKYGTAGGVLNISGAKAGKPAE